MAVSDLTRLELLHAAVQCWARGERSEAELLARALKVLERKGVTTYDIEEEAVPARLHGSVVDRDGGSGSGG
jgi:hypothetical protein